MSKSSVFSINTPFIFEMQEIKGALFSKAKDLFFLSLSCAPSPVLTVMSPLTTIYHTNQILALMF